MGNKLSSQQLQKLHSDRIDIYTKKACLQQIKTQDDIQTAIKQLLQIMTIRQKIGQLQQLSYGDKTISKELETQIMNGQVGSILNVQMLDVVNGMQKLAMEKSRLKIPLLIGKDVIHGFRTVFPIPLGQAASFNPDLIEQGSRVAAIECSSIGIKWTFSPMVDISRDPRWGRIAQSCGEDPYLASTLGSAMVKGYQTKNLKDITSVAACGKHYVGYGATEGGRDYNTTLIPENTLRDIYLTPFKSLCDSGILTYMSAFNDLNGEPSSANQFTLRQVLRKQWGFTGVVVTDYNAVIQLINHGFAENQKQAALRSFNSGIDMEMVSTTFAKYLEQLINQKKVSIQNLNTAVGNNLRVKFKMNLFQNYFTDPSRQKIILDPKHKELAKQLAVQCPVLLQNNKNSLPINKNIGSLAIIGALANDAQNQIGCWAPDGKAADSITPYTSLKQALTSTKIIYAQGYKDPRNTDTSLFNEAINAAKASEKVLLFLGEDNDLSGESHCRAFINLPGCQQELIKQLAKVGKPIIAVIYAGRSLILEPILKYVDSVLFAWHLGTMAGPALADLILGVTSPSGKLPITFLRAQGQIPLYYNKKNTGRPNNTKEYVPFTSSYIDIDSTPLYPFGFGLSYTSFTYSNFKLSRTAFGLSQSILATITVKNSGSVKADQTVLLFIRDLVGSYTRPVKQLKGYRRITLSSGQSTSVTFAISANDLKFWTKDKEYKAEPGKFNIWIGKNADEGQMGTVELLANNLQDVFEELI